MKPTHAGGVVFREIGDRREYLIVTAKADPKVWVLPKGHLEDDDDTVESAALREIAEEAGVVGEVVAELPMLEFENGSEAVRVAMFLVRFVGPTETTEGRKLAWLEADPAQQRLIEGARPLIQRAEEILRGRSLRKVRVLRAELDKLIGSFLKQSNKHKRMYRWLRYPAFFLTAAAGALASVAIAVPAHQTAFNLIIVGISAVIAVLTAVEGLRHPRELWIHERTIHHALTDLRRELDYRNVTACTEASVDDCFARLTTLLGASTAQWHQHVQQPSASPSPDA